MPIVMDNTLNLIRAAAASGGDRMQRAKRLAELVRKLGDYRWVGVYDVDAEHPTFRVGRGLTGAAIQEKKPVVVGDVRNDPRYLTLFSSTLSEIIVPILAPGEDRVIGTVDVESERASAFGPRDQQMIEQCAQAALPLWLLR
jgi:putative methionine-R-sulfoxide reductase with GAF domain